MRCVLQSQGDSVRAPQALAADTAGPSSSTQPPPQNGAASSSNPQQQHRSKRSKTREDRDADQELEQEMARMVSSSGSDPMAAYDLDIEEEGEAIQLYLALASA